MKSLKLFPLLWGLVIVALLISLAVEIGSIFMFVVAGGLLAYNIYRAFSKTVDADIVSVFMTTLVSTGVAYLPAGILSLENEIPVSVMMLSSMVVLWLAFFVGVLAKDADSKGNRIGGCGLASGIMLFAVAVFMEALNDMTGWSLRADVLSIVAAYIGFAGLGVMGRVLWRDKSIISFLRGLSMVMAAVGWSCCLALELLEFDSEIVFYVDAVLAWSFLLPLVVMIPIGIKRLEERIKSGKEKEM